MFLLRGQARDVAGTLIVGPPDTVRAMKLDRRWWFAIGAVVVVAVALVLSYTVFDKPPEECQPVQEMLDFNSAQAKKIEELPDSKDKVPSVNDDLVYQAWADGLADRAAKVSSPDLANTSVQLANLTDQFVAKLPSLRAEAQARAPGAEAPPVYYEMQALNTQIMNKLAELSKACS